LKVYSDWGPYLGVVGLVEGKKTDEHSRATSKPKQALKKPREGREKKKIRGLKAKNRVKKPADRKDSFTR